MSVYATLLLQIFLFAESVFVCNPTFSITFVNDEPKITLQELSFKCPDKYNYLITLDKVMFSANIGSGISLN